MVCRIVAGHELERIPGKGVATMVVDCLHGREAKEKHALAESHARSFEGETSTESIEEEPLKGVVVQRTVRIGNI